MRTTFPAVLAAAFTLCSCSQAPVPTAADSRRIDVAMARVQAEQARTDRNQARRKHEVAALYAESLKLPESQRGITAPPR